MLPRKQCTTGIRIFGRTGPVLDDFGEDRDFFANSELTGIELFWLGLGFPILYSI